MPAGNKIKTLFNDQFGWTRIEDAGVSIWFKGYIIVEGRTLLASEAARHIGNALADKSAIQALGRAVAALDGFFALVIVDGDCCVAAVDRVRSIPIFICPTSVGWAVGDNARAMATRSDAVVDDIGALSLALSGYAIAGHTLYKNITQIVAGEIVLIEPPKQPEIHRWYFYRPYRLGTDGTERLLRQRLLDTTLALIDKTARSVGDRTIMLPLSGGYDSRLIASALRHLGHRNVKCYAYGLAGNHEAQASQAVAERLGYEWSFVPYTPELQNRSFHSKTQKHYRQVADTCASLPFLQDFLAIEQLKAQQKVPADAVFINGNSGDFISGNHVPSILCQPATNLNWPDRWKKITQALLDKHYGLWPDLLTERVREVMTIEFEKILSRHEVGILSAESDHGIYEAIEFEERQSKFVISGQRVYEYWGHDWRLPLWDRDYLDFWEPIPIAHKAGQSLYREALVEANWGDVWRDIPLGFVPADKPYALHAVRTLAKILMLPFGRQAWQSVDRRVFHYWLAILSTYAETPYFKVLFDRRRFRSAVSYRCENYLNSHQLRYDGTQVL